MSAKKFHTGKWPRVSCVVCRSLQWATPRGHVRHHDCPHRLECPGFGRSRCARCLLDRGELPERAELDALAVCVRCRRLQWLMRGFACDCFAFEIAEERAAELAQRSLLARRRRRRAARRRTDLFSTAAG